MRRLWMWVWFTWMCGGALAPVGLGQSLDDPNLAAAPVASGMALPTTMGFLAPDDFLVLEKSTGRVRRVLNGQLLPGPVLDVNVNSMSERGLLGIAVNSQVPPSVFLFYTEAAGSDGGAPLGNRVYRYDWNLATEVLENPELILDLPVLPGPNHDGGIVALGPPGQVPGGPGDGAVLYAIIGDLNRNGQLQNAAGGALPDDSGVILRVLQDGSPAPGNPFAPYCSVTTAQTCNDDLDCGVGETCVTAVARYYAYGVRNSFGMALDPVTGALWDTENGPATNDEINLVAPGFNSGWRPAMGLVLNPVGLYDIPGAGSTYSPPEFTWFDTNAPTAIVFPSGSLLGPGYDDVALVADSNAGQIYAFPLNAARDGFDFSDPALLALQDLVANNNSERDLLRLGAGFGSITDLKIGPDGALYVVSLAFGTVYRVAPAAPVSALPTAAWLFLLLGLGALALVGAAQAKRYARS